MKTISFFSKMLLLAILLAPISASAQVTIGSNVLPQATLDIIGNPSETGQAFRLIDGNQEPGRVLTVGENGIATWEDIYYTPAGGAIVNTVIELAPALQADWIILTQRGVRVGSVCQMRITLQYNGTTPITISGDNAASSLGQIMATIIDSDFIPLDNSYTAGYVMQGSVSTGSFMPFTNAITTTGNILFRYIGTTEITTGDQFYMTAIYVPANFNESLNQ